MQYSLRLIHRLSKTFEKVPVKNLQLLTEKHRLNFRSCSSAFSIPTSSRFSTCANKTLMFRAPSMPLCHDDHLSHLPETISVTFVTKDGEKIEVMAREGERAMYLAHRKGIDMEGACEASLACTTCHCYVDSAAEHWDRLPEATETEEDLLDMAPFLEEHSRLGCQIIITPDIDGIVLRLPRATKNFYVDGHKPAPH